jgi:hypothetical protein
MRDRVIRKRLDSANREASMMVVVRSVSWAVVVRKLSFPVLDRPIALAPEYDFKWYSTSCLSRALEVL